MANRSAEPRAPKRIGHKAFRIDLFQGVFLQARYIIERQDKGFYSND